MRRRDFLKATAASAAGLVLGPLGCDSNSDPGADATVTGSDAGRRDASSPGADAATAGPDSGMHRDAGATRKVLHYFTDFSAPTVVLREGSGTSPWAMGSEGTGLARVEFGAAGSDAFFFLRDGAAGSEDHPPGGGDYRMPADLDEAWISKGTVFDVDPRGLTLDLVDAHTHPYDRAQDGTIIPATGPLLAVGRSAGIGLCVTSVKGPLAEQRTMVGALARDHAWLVPLVWVEPTRDTAADIEPFLRDDRWRGLKFHPTISAYDADGPAMDAFMALARKYEVPVQLHTATDEHARPARVAALASRFPDVKVVMVHTELGAADKRPALELVKGLPNVYAETSWMNADGVLLAMQLLDSSRTLFGTDATVDGKDHFKKTSIPDSSGNYTLTIPDVIAQVRARAHPDAYANWARLTATRLYGLRFRSLG